MPTSNLRIGSSRLRDRIKDFEGVADEKYQSMSRWRKFFAWFGSAITFNLSGPKGSGRAPYYIRPYYIGEASKGLGKLACYLDDLAQMQEMERESTVTDCSAMLYRVEKVTSLLDKHAGYLKDIHSSRNGRDYEAYHEVLDSLLENLRSTAQSFGEYLKNMRVPEDGVYHQKLNDARVALGRTVRCLVHMNNFASAERASSQEDFRDPATSVASRCSDSGRAPQRSQVFSDRPRQSAAQPARQFSAQQQRPATQRPSNKQSSGCLGCFSFFCSLFSPTPSRIQPARQQRADTASECPDLQPRCSR